MGGEKRKQNGSHDGQVKKLKSTSVNVFQLVAGLCLRAHGLAEMFLTTYLGSSDILLLCQFSKGISTFVAKRKNQSCFKFKYSILKFQTFGSLPFQIEYFAPNQTKAEFSQLAQRACTHDDPKMLRLMLGKYEVKANFKSYNLLIKASRSQECLQILLDWRGPDNEIVFASEDNATLFFDQPYSSAKVIQNLLNRFPDFRITRCAQLVRAIRDENTEALKVILASQRYPVTYDHFSMVCQARYKSGLQLFLKYDAVDVRSDSVFMRFKKANEVQLTALVEVFLSDGRFDPNLVCSRIDSYLCNKDLLRLAASHLQLAKIGANHLLRKACLWGWDSIIGILLNRKELSVHLGETWGTGLILAVQRGHKSIVEVLLAHSPFDPRDVEKALVEAARCGSLELIQLLLSYNRGANLDGALEGACLHKPYNTEVIKFLVAQPQTDPSINNDQPLTVACLCGDLELVVQIMSDPRVTPTAEVHLAAALNVDQFSVITILLADARVDATYSNYAVLRKLLQTGNIDLFKKLLKHPQIKKNMDV